jgi:hypothetical protein
MVSDNLISAITFPGIVIHELGHKFFCDLMNVRVHKVCYFRFGNPIGYVIHDSPRNFNQSFFITFGPFILGTLFALLFYTYSQFYSNNLIIRLLFIWLGASVAIRCFPSPTDAKFLWKETNRHIRKNPFAIIGYPFVLLLWITNLINTIWIDIAYAAFLYLLTNLYILTLFS